MENQTKICATCPTLAWPELIAGIAGPMSRFDTKESWLRRAATKTRLTLRSVKAIYYGEITDPKFSVGVAIIRAHNDARAAAARLDALTLASRFETIATGMQNADADFLGEDAAEIKRIARLLRGGDRA